MRIIALLGLGILACGASFGASRLEMATYVEGNLTGLTPQTEGTLVLADDKAMSLKTEQHAIPVVYSTITKAELGATKVHTQQVPLYKVWSLHKRFIGKTRTQYLTVDFKNEDGEDQTMTLELAQTAASDVLSAIQDHTGLGAKAKPAEWWGDDIWKTTRNADRWSKSAATPDK